MVSIRVVFGAMVLALAVLALSGCGGGSSTGSGTGGAAKPGEDTLAKIKREGVLKWGADAEGGAPFVYRDEKDTNKIIGFEMDMMDAIAKHLGVKHQREQAEWEQLIPALLSKRTDLVMNGIEINDDRSKAVSFSQPYYEYEQQLTVRTEDKDKYKTLDDLKGHRIATLANAESNNVLTKAGFKEDQLLQQKDSSLPYKLLSQKRADAVLQESIIAAFYAGSLPEYYNIPATFSPGKYGIVTRLEDKSLFEEVDRILKVMKENGELAAIYKKWNIWNDKQAKLGIVAK